MKPLLAASILFLLSKACKKNICCEYSEIDINISVLQKDTGIDLLNQSQPGHYDISKVLFEYPYAPNQKWTIALMPYDKPYLFKKNDIYYLNISPNQRDLNTPPIVTIYWTDTDIDVITFQIKKDRGFSYTDQVFVNNQLAATFPDDKVTILK